MRTTVIQVKNAVIDIHIYDKKMITLYRQDKLQRL